MLIVVTTIVCTEDGLHGNLVIKSPHAKIFEGISALKTTECLSLRAILTGVIICTFVTRAHSDTVIYFVDRSVSFSIQRILRALKIMKNVTPRFVLDLFIYLYKTFMIAYYLLVTVSAIE